MNAVLQILSKPNSVFPASWQCPHCYQSVLSTARLAFVIKVGHSGTRRYHFVYFSICKVSFYEFLCLLIEY